MDRSGAPPQSVRVMLVDDTDHVRRVVAEILALDGFEVVAQVADGTGAVEAALAARPHVVVMDLRMPGVDGLEATRQLRAALPGVQVVLYTAFVDGAVERSALAAGAALCLSKAEGLPRLGRELSRLTLALPRRA